jgi:hypothetical protein
VHVSSKINLEKGTERLRNKIRENRDATGKKEEEGKEGRGWGGTRKRSKKRNYET